MSQTVNIIVTQTVLADSVFKESVDLALVCAAFDQTVNLIFVDNGVFNLIKNQNYHNLNDKNHLAILKGLEFYDVNNMYVERESLDSRHLSEEQLIEDCQLVTAIEINQLNRQSNQVVSL